MYVVRVEGSTAPSRGFRIRHQAVDLIEVADLEQGFLIEFRLVRKNRYPIRLLDHGSGDLSLQEIEIHRTRFAVERGDRAVSICFAIPVGGENVAGYQGHPRLTGTIGDETFETLRDGLRHQETADRGEVIRRGDVGVTCRRWNWRQSIRTRIEPTTTDTWFVLERLDPMPLAALEHAGNTLADLLKRITPDAVFSQTLIDRTAKH